MDYFDDAGMELYDMGGPGQVFVRKDIYVAALKNPIEKVLITEESWKNKLNNINLED